MSDVFVGPSSLCVAISPASGGGVRCGGPGGGVGSAIGAGFRDVPALSSATKIAMSRASGCAILASQKLACFGASFGATIDAPRVVDLVAKDVVANDDAVCALSAEGDVGCGAELTRPLAHAAPKVAVGAGAASVCSVDADAVMTCAGELSGVRIAGATKVAVTAGRACAILRDGSVTCAQKGGVADAPRQVGALDIAFQGASLCVLHAGKTLSCEDHGALSPLPGVFSVAKLAGAGGDACFVSGQEHVAFCWGDNASAELGTKAPEPREVPAALFFRDLREAVPAR